MTTLFELLRHYSTAPRAADSTTPPYMSPATLQLLGLSIDEAHKLDHNYITTGHLVLGLLRQEAVVTRAILERFNVAPSEAKLSIQRALVDCNDLFDHPTLLPTMTLWESIEAKAEDLLNRLCFKLGIEI